ncbi:hypothetical protein V1514DRAFT_349591 [Lipomyces japonicus]|uniref:uncharacterized protein n=1 Tax=Lipomyces japonicus TaxID=56871 RepID=UPI0034CD4759
MSGRLEKTIERIRQRIADKEFYEAHQALKTVAARYIKAKQYDQAIELLYHGAQELLRAGEGGSGGDLSNYLIETYRTANVPVEGQSKARIVQLFKLFKEGEPRRKEFISEISQWTASAGQFGDTELNHIIGTQFAREDSAYEAEKYLLVGTKDSVPVLVQLLFDWFSEDEQAGTAPFYLSRAILGYLALGNIRDARTASDLFISKLVASDRIPGSTLVTSSVDGDAVTVFAQSPLLDFLQLLVRACQRKNPDMFKRLRFRYKTQLSDAGALDEALDKIGEIWFGIRVQNQGNLLQDLMGSLFSGGSRGGNNPPVPQIADLE